MWSHFNIRVGKQLHYQDSIIMICRREGKGLQIFLQNVSTIIKFLFTAIFSLVVNSMPILDIVFEIEKRYFSWVWGLIIYNSERRQWICSLLAH